MTYLSGPGSFIFKRHLGLFAIERRVFEKWGLRAGTDEFYSWLDQKALVILK